MNDSHCTCCPVHRDVTITNKMWLSPEARATLARMAEYMRRTGQLDRAPR